MFCPNGLLPIQVCTSSSVMSSNFYLLKACGEIHKRQAWRNKAAENSLYWDLHQTGTSERRKITDGICWVWYIWGRLFLAQDPTPQQLKTLKSDCDILLALSEHPSFTTASRSLLCSLPWSVLRAFHASQQCKAGLQAEQLMPITEPVSPEGQQYRTLPHSLVCSPKLGEPSYSAMQGTFCKHMETLSSRTAMACFPQFKKHSKVQVYYTKAKVCSQTYPNSSWLRKHCPKTGIKWWHIQARWLQNNKEHMEQPVLKPRQQMLLEGESAIQTMT